MAVTQQGQPPSWWIRFHLRGWVAAKRPGLGAGWWFGDIYTIPLISDHSSMNSCMNKLLLSVVSSTLGFAVLHVFVFSFGVFLFVFFSACLLKVFEVIVRFVFL